MSRAARRRRAAHGLMVATLLILCADVLAVTVTLRRSSSAPTTPIVGIAVDRIEAADAFTASTATRPKVLGVYRGFAHDGGFDAGFADAAASRGAVPLITWEPWDFLGGTDQPRYDLASLLDGEHDDYIRLWAQRARDWGKPLLLRFAHEMNNPVYPWAEGVNGNQPGSYVRTWLHVRSIFDDIGADNVLWIWSPNVVTNRDPVPLPSLYPGDAKVDVVALDGHNFGATEGHRWSSFTKIFGPSLVTLAQITDKPVLLGEVASAEAGGDKAAWITDLFTEIASRPQVIGFVWFEVDKEVDWRVRSSPKATTAFTAARPQPGPDLARNDTKRLRRQLGS